MSTIEDIRNALVAMGFVQSDIQRACKLSSLEASSKNEMYFVGRECVRCMTNNTQPSFMALDIKPIVIKLTHYTLKHHNSFHAALTSWTLEGSNDGSKWTVLSIHIADSSLRRPGDTMTWPIDINTEGNDYFSQFRIYMTDVNSSGRWYLACSGIELYGHAHGGLVLYSTAPMIRRLNSLWHQTMVCMGEQEVFQQQSHVLKRLKSYDFSLMLDDYNNVLQEVVKIHQRKAHIHSEEVLARNFIKQFGFIVPQSVEIEDVYENIIQIYRKIEEIEKHKMSKKANQFIHILDDFKYNDDFQNNEDNIIGDFKPKTIDYTCRKSTRLNS
eukprot:447458_1